MSVTNTHVKVRHRTNSQTFSEAQIQTQSLSHAQKFLYGSKFFGICFGAAILFALIPILHFVLVPIALIVGVALFIKGLGISDFYLDSSLSCPNCNKTFTLKAGATSWPIKELCPECRTELVIERSNP